jgi:hypothetical protein
MSPRKCDKKKGGGDKDLGLFENVLMVGRVGEHGLVKIRM